MSFYLKENTEYIITTEHIIRQFDVDILKKIKNNVGAVEAACVLRWKSGCSITDARKFIDEL